MILRRPPRRLAGWRIHLAVLLDPAVIDPEFGALHESAHGLWLGPPKTPASARTITLPAFLIELLFLNGKAKIPGEQVGRNFIKRDSRFLTSIRAHFHIAQHGCRNKSRLDRRTVTRRDALPRFGGT